jgi:hypothetical protein
MYKQLMKLKKHHRLLYGLIIAVGLMSIWRGTWLLSDVFIFPSNTALSAVTSVLIGIIILSVMHYKLS